MKGRWNRAKRLVMTPKHRVQPHASRRDYRRHPKHKGRQQDDHD